jgi:hypothetical protein
MSDNNGNKPATQQTASAKQQFLQSLAAQARAGIVVDTATAYWDEKAGHSRRIPASIFETADEVLRMKIEMARLGAANMRSEYLVRFDEADLPVRAVWLRKEAVALKLGDKVSVGARTEGGKVVLTYKK